MGCHVHEGEGINSDEDLKNILTSFLMASRMSDLSSLRQVLILARRRFSIIGLLLCGVQGGRRGEGGNLVFRS